MPIDVIFDAQAEGNRKYSGVCPSCSSSMQWLKADAKVVVEADGLTPAHSLIDCPVVVTGGGVCGAEVTGRLM